MDDRPAALGLAAQERPQQARLIVIPYGRHDVVEADIEAVVVGVLRSEWLTQGPIVPQFERRLAAYCGVSSAVAVNSGTSALHIACLALGLGNGDLLWTSPITFVASANCALYCGASVDFVDIDPQTYNLCPRCACAKARACRTARKVTQDCRRCTPDRSTLRPQGYSVAI